MPSNSSALAETQAFVGGGGIGGYQRRMASPDHRRRVLAVAQLFESALRGDRYAMLEFGDLMRGSARQVREEMSTSDFPILFGDTLSRELARRYENAQPVWRQFAARQLKRDFRASKIIDFTGGRAILDQVRELAPYPERAKAESSFETMLAKYGARLAWSWEDQVNDDLGAFGSAPNDLSVSAVNTEDYLATSVLCTAAGPNTTLLGTAGTAALSTDALEAGIASITQATDDDGNPIVIGTPILVVPQALALTAQNIVNTTEIRTTSGSKQSLVSGNGLSATPRIVVNPWLSVIDQTANKNTTWYLLPDPSGPRPAVYLSFLAGYESPDLRVKADAGMRLGGGTVDPSEGSFERDSVEYRVRHVVGGNAGFDDAVYVSNGSA